MVVFIGVFGALLGTGLFVWGIAKVHSVKAAIAADLEPVAASGLASLWFGQVLAPQQALGALLILGAVVLLHEPVTPEFAHPRAEPAWPRRAGRLIRVTALVGRPTA